MGKKELKQTNIKESTQKQQIYTNIFQQYQKWQKKYKQFELNKIYSRYEIENIITMLQVKDKVNLKFISSINKKEAEVACQRKKNCQYKYLFEKVGQSYNSHNIRNLIQYNEKFLLISINKQHIQDKQSNLVKQSCKISQNQVKFLKMYKNLELLQPQIQHIIEKYNLYDKECLKIMYKFSFRQGYQQPIFIDTQFQENNNKNKHQNNGYKIQSKFYRNKIKKEFDNIVKKIKGNKNKIHQQNKSIEKSLQKPKETQINNIFFKNLFHNQLQKKSREKNPQKNLEVKKQQNAEQQQNVGSIEVNFPNFPDNYCKLYKKQEQQNLHQQQQKQDHHQYNSRNIMDTTPKNNNNDYLRIQIINLPFSNQSSQNSQNSQNNQQ